MSATKKSTQSKSTRERIISVAEALFLQHGFEKVSARTIVREAGLANQSALNYHFGDRDGLILALAARQIDHLDQLRKQMIGDALTRNPNLDLRTACYLLMKPVLSLAQSNKNFRAFLGHLGPELSRSLSVIPAISDAEEVRICHGVIQRHLKDSLSTEDKRVYDKRMNGITHFTLFSFTQRAHDGETFSGRDAELFFHNLLDVLIAMITTSVSSVTLKSLESS